MNILILTVGGSHASLLTAIETIKPERVIFLCSDDQGEAMGSYSQVEGAGKVLCSNAPKRERTKPDLPNLATLANLSPDRYEVIRISQFDNVQECFQNAARVIRQQRSSHPDARIIADYTGGTKSMTAGLAIAALDDERCELSLVTGTRRDLSVVQPGTQFAHAVAVWDLRAQRRFQQIAEALNRFDYATAHEGLKAVAMTHINGMLLSRVRAGIAACRAFDAWDRFAHADARDLLRPYRDQFVGHFLVLDELCAAQPTDPFLSVDDLILNAERRAAQGRFDDAVARIYRALEMVAQLRLRQRHAMNTADIDIARVPVNFQEQFEKKRREDGKLATALFDSWKLLSLLRDKPLGDWFDANNRRLTSFLAARNYSILAHGEHPISRTVYESEGTKGLSLCLDALEQLIEDRGQRRAQQLPQALPWLEQNQEV